MIPKPPPRERLPRWQHARKPINQKGAVAKRYEIVRQEFLAGLDAHLHRCVYCRKPCRIWRDSRGDWRTEWGFEVHHTMKRSTEPGHREDRAVLVVACFDCHDAQPGHHPHVRTYGRRQTEDLTP
jgi:5-methylcytosine-specific restriction endonuclease McrA